MLKCPYCGGEVPEKYNFCLSCNRQVKCLNCRELLVPEKSMCFVCGHTIGSDQSLSTSMNEFTLEEKQTRTSAYRKINGRLSDNAFGQAAALFSGLPQPQITRSPIGVTSQSSSSLALPSPATDVGGEQEAAESLSNAEDGEVIIPGTALQNTDPERLRALKYFRGHGENDIIAKITDFKGKKRKDQQDRFFILYVWAYNAILGRPVSSKSQVIDAAKRIKVYDSNTNTYFQQVARGYLLHSDEGFELNTRGIQVVDKFLSEIDNETVPEGFEYWKGSSKPGQKRQTLSKEEEQKVKTWIEVSIDVGKLDVRELRTPTICAMFAFWCITKGTGSAKAVKPKMAYLYLTQKYTTISVKPRSFTDCLSRDNNRVRFNRNADGLYYLTPQAEREVESWIKGEQIMQEADFESPEEEGDND